MRRVLAALLGALVVIAAAGFPVYVRPQQDPLRAADAVVVLGGSHSGARYQRGLQLAHAGWAHDLVLSNPYGGADPFLDRLCAAAQPRFRVRCFDPDPHSTLGEARQIRDLAAAEHWHTVIVVTSVPHVSRARYIIGKCWAGALVMQGTPVHLGPLGWAAMYVYQSAGYLKSVLHGSC